MRKVYLDANATTRVHPEGLQEMMPFLEEMFGNPSSVHSFGREAQKYIDIARSRVAALIGASSKDEIIFTSGGTESNNHAIKILSDELKSKGKHIITTSVEHKSVLESCKWLEKNGFDVTYLDVGEKGIIDPIDLENSIREDTVLVTVMAANNETGAIMPINEIGRITSSKGVLFHTDAVQIAGKLPFNVSDINAGLVSLSGHKLNGPKGTGALYVKKGIEIGRLIDGGSQELARRGGTQNVPGIIGFGKACAISALKMSDIAEKVKPLRDRLHKFIDSSIDGAVLNGDIDIMLPNTLNISFQGISGKSLIMSLDLEGIAVSSGSACQAGSAEPSHVLKAMGVGTERLSGAIRFSLDRFNTSEDIDLVIEKLPIVIDRIKHA